MKKQSLSKKVVILIAALPFFLFGAVVFGKEDTLTSSEFKSPESKPDLLVVPLLDPDVAVVNPKSEDGDIDTKDKDVDIDSINFKNRNDKEESGELQKIEKSIDDWIEELEKIDRDIMEKQRGDASADVVSEREESKSKDPDKKDKKDEIDLKTLKKNRKSLKRDIKKAGEVVSTSFNDNDEIKEILESVKNSDFNPNEIQGELEDIEDTNDETKKQKKLRKLDKVISKKVEKIEKRAILALESKSEEESEEVEDIEKDTDNDGVSDYDEVNIYETDPLDNDTDGDGYSDGLEILVGFNPINDSSVAVIKYQNPKNANVRDTDMFSVSKVEFLHTTTDTDVDSDSEQILFEGKALPNSFVTLYIFSIPTIVTIKTDRDGNWTYILDKELENGDHELYVTTTDNSGKILAKSSPVPFTKEVAAVTIDEGLLISPSTTGQPGFFSGSRVYGIILFLVAIIGGFFVFLGRRKNKDEFHIG